MLWGFQKPSPAWRGWTGRSPGRMREKTLSWERVAGRSPDGCGAGRRTGPDTAPLPPLRRHLPPREGKRTPAGGSPPHPSGLTPCHLPRRGRLPPGGITVYLLCCLSGISPGDSSTGCYTAVERGCEEGDIHKNTPQLFYKLWRNFLGFPGGSGGRAGERGGQFASFCFFSSYIQVYPQSFPGFPQNLSTAVDTAVDKFKSLFGITCSGRHRWLRRPSYRHPWPG